MANVHELVVAFAVVGTVAMLFCGARAQAQVQGLRLGFYAGTCPAAEGIVRKVAQKHIPLGRTVAAPLLRMHFHDCFVRGCDGSILLNATSSSNPAEKDAVPNRSLRGFNFIDEAKQEIERVCPGVVSCADILALMARDAILVAFGGPFWEVATGRRDGLISSQAEATANIPGPTSNISQLKSSFSGKGLTDAADLVALSGSHTVGITHCQFFKKRLYNFTGRGSPNDVDPTMDPAYITNLKKFKCTSPSANSPIVEMDPGSFLTFDDSYFKLILKHRGIFQSDAALLDDPTTKALVQQYATDPQAFFNQFSESMVKMGQIGVLTGSQGQIRRHCAFVNSS